HTPPQLKKALAAAVVAADPARAQERHDKEVARREVRLDPAPDGMAWLSLYTGAEDAVSTFTCLDTIAAHTDADDERGIDARRADAMTGIFANILSTGNLPDGATLPTVHGRRPQVRITVTEPVLAGDAQTPAVLHGYGPITAGTARTLAAHGYTQAAAAGPATTAGPPAAAGDQGVSAQQTTIKDQTSDAGHCAQARHTPSAPAASAGQHQAPVRTQAQGRALYDPDPMDEVLPRPRPPGHPDGSDPGELAGWVDSKNSRPSRRPGASEFGTPPGTTQGGPATAFLPAPESPPGAEPPPRPESPRTDSPPGEASWSAAEAPVAVRENQLGIMATDAY